MPLTFTLQGARTCSVYGGAGGYGTRISSSRSFYGSSWRSVHSNGCVLYEKGIMQKLNDRLASHLPNLNSLERKNAELEKKIKEWCTSHTVESHDYSEYLVIIKSLQEQIEHISKSNGEIELQIKNTCLAVEDFRTKYGLELAIRKDIETDTTCLRKTMDEMTLTRSAVEMKYESLKEDFIKLEKNHKEEKAQIRAKAFGQVEVIVDELPLTDLSQTMISIREDYEALAAKNQRDLDIWYKSKILPLEKKYKKQIEDLDCNTKELSRLKSDFHNKEIELEYQHSMTMSLKDRVQNSMISYAARLEELRQTTTVLEVELEQIRANKKHKQQDCENLKAEIKEYNLLLESKQSDIKVTQKTVQVVEVLESIQTVTEY